MTSNMYADLTSLDDLNEMELRLNKRVNHLFSFNPPRDMEGNRLTQLKYIDTKRYESTEESFNKRWKDPDNWYILDEIAPAHFKKVGLTVKIPTLIFLSEELKRYANNELVIEGEALAEDAKSIDSLRKELLSIRERLDPARSYLVRELVKMKKPLIDYIEKRWVHVESYDPHYSKNPTWDMVELLEEVERAYRGVMCGSVFAYECLIGEYVKQERIGELWKGTEAILKETKEYVKYQVALERFDPVKAKILTEPRREKLNELLKAIREELHQAHFEKGKELTNEYVLLTIGRIAKHPIKFNFNDRWNGKTIYHKNGKAHIGIFSDVLSSLCAQVYNFKISDDTLRRDDRIKKHIKNLGLS